MPVFKTGAFNRSATSPHKNPKVSMYLSHDISKVNNKIKKAKISYLSGYFLVKKTAILYRSIAFQNSKSHAQLARFQNEIARADSAKETITKAAKLSSRYAKCNKPLLIYETEPLKEREGFRQLSLRTGSTKHIFIFCLFLLPFKRSIKFCVLHEIL